MESNCGQFYSRRLGNDEHKAVEYLDKFTKAFCIDATVSDDLSFRCDECPFLCSKEEDSKVIPIKVTKNYCQVKIFKNKFAPDYKDFGSMGDL